MIVLYSVRRFCLAPAIHYPGRSYPAAAGQVLRTQLGKGKLAGVRLRPAARGVAAVPVLRRTVCAAGTGPESGAKKRRDNPSAGAGMLTGL